MFHHLRTPDVDGIGVAFTDAELDLGDAQPRTARSAAYERLGSELGVRVAVTAQVHGSDVLEIETADDALVDRTDVRADALLTRLPGVALAVRVADCIPVLFADPDAGWVAAAHAGRAGVLNGVVGATVEALAARGATQLLAWIGPHVCGPCYEVPDAMAADFERVTGVAPVATPQGTLGLDLGAAVRRQLDVLGVPYSSHEACTRESAALHSYRRDGSASGRLAGLVWRVESR